MAETGFPSVFNAERTLVTRARLLFLKDKLQKQLKLTHLNKAERIKKLNLLTYVCCCYVDGFAEEDGVSDTEVIKTAHCIKNTGELKGADGINSSDGIKTTNSISDTASSNTAAILVFAFDSNDEAMKLSDWTNVTSILYRIHLMEEKGDTTAVDQCRVKLKKIKSSPGHKLKLAEAQAEIAFTLCKLGGLDNILRAIHWYQEGLKNGDTDNCKFGLGMANSKVVRSHKNSPDLNFCKINKHMLQAVRFLMDAAKNSMDPELRGVSYSKLAFLKSNLNYSKIENKDCRLLFKGQNVQSLVEKALECDPKHPKTLRNCGRLLKKFDLDKAIELLEKSVKIMDDSCTYHNLAICYKNKALKNAVREERKQEENSQLNYVSKEGGLVLSNQVNIENKEDTASSGLDGAMVKGLVSQNEDSEVLVKVTSEENVKLSEQLPENSNDAVLGLFNKPEPPTNPENFNSGTWRRKKKKKHNIASNKDCPAVAYPLDRQDEYVDKAIEYHLKSIQLSSDTNYMAMYTLGLILRACGCLPEARAQFQKIVDDKNSQSLETRKNVVKPVTVISAYMQLGLCSLDTFEQSEAGYYECEAQMLKAIDAVGEMTSDPSVTGKLGEGLSKTMDIIRRGSSADAEIPRYAFNKFINMVTRSFQRIELSAHTKNDL